MFQFDTLMRFLLSHQWKGLRYVHKQMVSGKDSNNYGYHFTLIFNVVLESNWIQIKDITKVKFCIESSTRTDCKLTFSHIISQNALPPHFFQILLLFNQFHRFWGKTKITLGDIALASRKCARNYSESKVCLCFGLSSYMYISCSISDTENF